MQIIEEITDADYRNTYVGTLIDVALDKCRREGKVDPLFNDYKPEDIWDDHRITLSK